MNSVLLSLLLLQQGPAAPPAATFEMLSLHPLTQPAIAAVPPVWGSFLTCRSHDGRRPDLLGCGEDRSEPTMTSDQVLHFLRAMHAEECEAGRLRLDLDGSRLMAYGEPQLVDTLRQQTQALTAAALRPVQLEVALWDLGPGSPPPTRLRADQYAQFAAQRTALWRSTGSTRSSRPVVLGRERWTRYLRDANVEVAQKATIADPQLDAFGEGGSVAVAPHLLAGSDDVVLHVQFGLAERQGAVARVSTGVPAQPDLDVPTLASTFGACSARVQSGGALAVTLAGFADGGGSRVLTVRATAGAKVAPPTGIAVLPVGALTSYALSGRIQVPARLPNPDEEEQDIQVEVSEDDDTFGYIPASRLADLIHTSLGDAAESDFELHFTNDLLFVRGADDKAAAVTRFLAGLEERLLHDTTVRHDVVLPAEGRQPASHVHTLVAPSLVGRHLGLARIVETNVLRDVQVEIAQEAQASDPIVDSHQTGVWLSARVLPGADRLFLVLQARCVAGEIEPLRRIDPAGTLTLPSLVTAKAAHDGSIGSGERLDHGDGPVLRIDGRACRSELVTTVDF